MASLLEKLKQRQAEREGKPYVPPKWPEEYPKLLDIKPKPIEGYIEERIIYRQPLNSNDKKEHCRFYVSAQSMFFYLDTLDKQVHWSVLSFEEYKAEYERVFELVKKHGSSVGRIKFSELQIFDEIVSMVPTKLIMELKPSPEEIDEITEGQNALLEERFSRPTQEDKFLDSIDT